MMQATLARAHPGFYPRPSRADLVEVSGALAAVLLFGTFALLQDREALGLAVAATAGFLLIRTRRARFGRVLLGAIFVATLAFMLPGAVVNLAQGQGLLAYALPLSLATISTTGLVGLITRRHAVAIGIGALVLFAIALTAGVIVEARTTSASTLNGLSISARTNAFSTSSLTAAPGKVTVSFANHDLFWHTFTIDALGIDLKVPVNATAETTFDAPPGTYEFYCAIPGHALIGMKGTLTITNG